MAPVLENILKRELGVGIASMHPLSGGCVGEVYRADLSDGRKVVAKVDGSARPRLDIEGYMLQYLAAHSTLPVPEVLWCEPALLVMGFVEGASNFSDSAQRHAARLLGELHQNRGAAHGLEKATLIGGLHQPNTWSDSWVACCQERRLLDMAREAHRAGALPAAMMGRIENFATHLEQWLEEPDFPALLHGDVWTTNVLAAGKEITGFIDPAVYYGHPEIELAFITLFSTFGAPFFDAYDAQFGIRPGFFERRRDIYNLYPLLVHVRLFGASYLSGVDRTLRANGY